MSYPVLRFACLLSFSSLLSFPEASAQAGGPLTAALSCQGGVPGCDRDFFQTELPFVRFVRDQADAEVFVLVTSEETGGGGRFYTLSFQGQRGRAAGHRETLAAVAGQGATRDAQRQAILSRLALGLAGYAARAGLADGLRVAYTLPPPDPDAPGLGAGPADPWNAWVFRLRGNGSAQGQQSFSSLNTSGSFTASRVTEAWKVSLRPFGTYTRSTFTLRDGQTVVSANSSLGASAEVVRALGPHWSGAFVAGARRSTFENVDLSVRAGPAVEYNVFPYAESTRRQLRLSYGLEGEAVAYVDTTIFNRLDERLLRHAAGAVASFAQPWGSADVGLDLSHYLSRPDKYRAQLFGSASVRVARGLNVNGFTRFAFVRDQLSLRAGGASDEEVLTRQRQLATSFDYSASVGVSYTFGSVFSDVVNARFGS